MAFDPRAYGDDVGEILALEGNGQRLMPLAHGRCCSEEARRRIARREPDAVAAGLYLYFSCLDEAHAVAQSIQTAEGSYWHAILHRQEPDPGNSTYWFRRVGRHPIFPMLREAAEGLIPVGADWDPLAFIDLCERVRREPGSDLEAAARRVQLAEWQLLFDYCARGRA